MPRFYFDVHDGVTFHDPEGLDCPDLQAAEREAIQAAGSMLRDIQEFSGAEKWTMQVRDDKGEIVATLTFSATWHSAGEKERR